MNRFLNKVLDSKLTQLVLMPLREQSVLFVYSVLMSCVVIPVMCYTTGAFPKAFVFSLPIFDCYLLTLLAFCLRRVRLSWLVWLLGICLMGGEVFSLLCYQSPYSMTVLQLVLETNSREATEFLSGHGVMGQLLQATATSALTIAAAFCVVRFLKNKKASAGKVALLCLLTLSALCQGYSYFRLWQAYSAKVTTTIAENKYMPLRNSPFVRFLYGHALNVVSTRELGELVKTVRQTEVENCSFSSPIVLLIIGESYNKYHSPLYNKEARQTTPNLCRMHQQGNLVVYDDAVSPYNVTSKTFRHMFSTYYPGCGRDWVDCTLLPAVFKKAGYRVWFVTNQFAGEANNKDHHGHAGGTIFNHSELRALQFSHMNAKAYRYDMELLRELPSADSLKAQPSLLIFHVIGQHEDYRERYPDAYDVFKGKDISNPYTDDHGRQIVAEFDNATLYNDAVTAALLEKYAGEDVVAVYLADHGEEVYDWRNSCYRTNSDLMTPEIAKYQYGIPLLFYMSDTYKTNHPELVEEIQNARHKPFISTMLPFMLFHLAGIDHADYDPTLDILSPQYDENRPRMIRDDVCYDEIKSEIQR